MIDLPSKIKIKFLEIKKLSKKYVEIKKNKNYYFVYEATSRWDKENKRVVKLPRYLGRITDDGKFIPSKPRMPKAVEVSVPSVLPVEVPQISSEIADNQISTFSKPNKYEVKLLTALSMNGRIPNTILSKIIDLKETATIAQVKKLEKKYDARYIAEVDVSKLGYLQFLITVKFVNRTPKIKELKEALIIDPRVQLALMLKGEFDLIIYALAKDSGEIIEVLINIREKLKEYEAIWNSSPIYISYGFLPVRDEFIDLLKDKFLTREYAVLKELNKNGRLEFTEIDKKYKFDKGRSQYSYYKLKEAGILKRITISIQKIPLRYIGIIFKDVVNYAKFTKNREKSLSDIIEQTNNQVNKYLLVDDILTPYGVTSYLPIFDYDTLDKEIEKLADFDLGIKLTSAVVTNIILGDFCYRKFDDAHSSQQEILERDYGMSKVTKMNYEETGRKRKPSEYTTDSRGARLN